MPNWCDNSVTLYSKDKEKIDALDKVLTNADDTSVFNHLFPRPADQEDNWYEWNCQNWGTKWDVTPIDWERYDDNKIWISFNSAWSPPISLYEYLSENGWNVEAYYHESGCAFCGKYTTEDGDAFYEYDYTDRKSLEMIPEDIDNFTGLLDYHDSYKADGEFDEEKVD